MTEKLDHGPKVMFVNGEVCAAIYKPLDNTHQEIRLLTLLPPRDGDANIHCTLSHAVLNNASSENPKYEALSYVWGEPDFSEAIILNNHTFFITPSLKYILSCLRQRGDEPRVLWVDAICINQSDVEERGHQVALMREIYSNCQRDIAWLDPMIGKKGVKARDLYNHPDLDQEENWVRCGMELMREIAEKNPQTLKELQDQAREGYRLLTGSQLALGAVFRQPTLWSRLWVMQELSLAPRLTLMSRDAELSWDVLKNLFKDEPYFDAFHMGRESSHSLGYYKDFSEVFVPIKLIEDQRRLMTQGKGSKLMDVLVRFREMESTDPRDKIFGLLGLVTEDHGVNVDYMTSVPELYQQATASLINLAGNLDILCQNPFERPAGPRALDGQRKHKLPSWVAEYDSKRRQCATMLFAQRGIFNAGVKNCETPCRLIGPGKDILVMKGTILGTVAPVLQDGKDLEARDVMNLYLGKEVLEQPQGHMYAPKVGGKEIPTGDTTIRAFWRTMVKDCTLPPRMRRLRPTEIERLDIKNQEQLKSEWSPLQTYRLHFGNKYSRSAFGYQPADDEDLAKLDIEGQISHHYSPGSFKFAVTDNGLFLATRFAAKQGDVVAVLDGGKVPLALRKVEPRDGFEGELYMVVGSTYVHGFMDGEAEAGVTEGWLEKREILVA
ncbi:Het6 heterokaryon incompatibility protein [Fusarium tjaetaba]|uniref:Het6 heterokaryon incompatibility protein n=1 Tax=Fusarium tjaetaba TaxID=1567544 RepID=A0A8H5SA02_9HYPO|nr:Het6 heterokaryon incompatibility protein [Fusarium tjaetaba]KAF5649059.1 Het6 heterokaryon incompatibility protein [Fusarium tjaetaba]